MENIEKLRKSAKIKLIVTSIATVFPIVLMILLKILAPKIGGDTALPDLVVLRFGILAILECYIGYKISKYIRILINIDYATNEIVKKQDERNKFIELKTDAKSLKLSIYALGIALIVAAFIDRLVFYSLFIVLIVCVLIYLFVKLYYTKKY